MTSLNRRKVLGAGIAAAAGGVVLGRNHAGAARPSLSAINVHHAGDRGHANHGWLDSFHSFSFANYYDPAKMGFRALRVINEDRIDGDSGFPMHPHRDMEIITYVLEGALEHKDSLGNGGLIKPGEVQRMSAGTGILHSEFNASNLDPVHLLQIWLLPNRVGEAPSYDQKLMPMDPGRFRVIASPDGEQNSLSIRQNARLLAATLGKNDGAEFVVQPGRSAWIQVAKGRVMVNGHPLEAGDAASTSDPGTIEIVGDEGEVLLFDLA
jgi:redox-sensitive bicupin YhaK (pirin superfamily)